MTSPSTRAARVPRWALAIWAASVVVPGAAAQAPPPQPPSASTLPIELVGVMVDAGHPDQSTCLIRCTYPEGQRRTAILEVGQPACALAEIREIGPDAVVVRNLLTGRLERLPLLRAEQAPGATAEPAVSPDPAPPRIVRSSPGQVTVEMPKASVAQYLANLPDLLNSALASPRYRDAGGGPRAIDGFELSQIRDGSVADRVGLKNGDTIVALNGEKLDSLATVLRLFGQAQSMAQVKLTVERDGKPMTFVINTK